jgi:hypothetical protein
MFEADVATVRPDHAAWWLPAPTLDRVERINRERWQTLLQTALYYGPDEANAEHESVSHHDRARRTLVFDCPTGAHLSFGRQTTLTLPLDDPNGGVIEFALDTPPEFIPTPISTVTVHQRLAETYAAIDGFPDDTRDAPPFRVTLHAPSTRVPIGVGVAPPLTGSPPQSLGQVLTRSSLSFTEQRALILVQQGVLPACAVQYTPRTASTLRGVLGQFDLDGCHLPHARTLVVATDSETLDPIRTAARTAPISDRTTPRTERLIGHACGRPEAALEADLSNPWRRLGLPRGDALQCAYRLACDGELTDEDVRFYALPPDQPAPTESAVRAHVDRGRRYARVLREYDDTAGGDVGSHLIDASRYPVV